MQGDIFQLDSMLGSAKATTLPAAPVRRSKPSAPAPTTPSPAIYNEDDLSELLWADNRHPLDDFQLPHPHPADQHIVLNLPSGPHHEEEEADSESGTSPVLSDVEDEDEEFPVFVGRQADVAHVEQQQQQKKQAVAPVSVSVAEVPCSEPSSPVVDDIAGGAMCMWPSIVPAGAQVTAAVHCAEKPSVPVTTATTTTTKVQQPEQDEYEPQVDDIAGPAMQWWPEPEPAPRRAADCWAVERAQWARRAQGHGLVRPVDDIEGALMSWWPAPAEMLVRREWDERFYE